MKMTTLVITSALFAATTAYAGNTDLTSNWICTTNASSSDVQADKAADQQMADKAQAIADAFSMASQHCRDCTKITCEVKS